MTTRPGAKTHSHNRDQAPIASPAGMLEALQAIRAGIEAVNIELRAIRAEIAAPPPDRYFSSAENVAADAQLVAKIVRAVDPDGFQAWEVIDAAERDTTNTLREAIERACRKKFSVEVVGKFLGRLAGKEIDGVRIERIGQQSGSALWCVRGLRG